MAVNFGRTRSIQTLNHAEIFLRERSYIAHMRPQCTCHFEWMKKGLRACLICASVALGHERKCIVYVCVKRSG